MTAYPSTDTNANQASPSLPTGHAMVWLAVLLEMAAVVAAVLRGATVQPEMLWLALLCVHATAALACWVALRMMDRHEAARQDPSAHASSHAAWRLMAYGTAALGPLGVVGGALSVALKHWFDKRGVAHSPAWLSVMGPTDPAADGLRRNDEKIEAALIQRPSVSPFADIMARGTATQKQDVVVAIGANFKPQFARTLKRALNDREPTVRMMAAATASRIENEYLDSSMTLESDWANDPEDARRAIKLARHYDEYANTGLLDDARADESRERALEMYQIAAEIRRDDPLIAHAIIRLLVKLNREDEAIALFKPMMDKGRASATLASWYLEALYRRRHFAELRHYSTLLLEQERQANLLEDRSLQAAHLWARSAATQTGIVPLELDDVLEPGDARRALKQVINVPYFAPRWAGS